MGEGGASHKGAGAVRCFLHRFPGVKRHFQQSAIGSSGRSSSSSVKGDVFGGRKVRDEPAPISPPNFTKWDGVVVEAGLLRKPHPLRGGMVSELVVIYTASGSLIRKELESARIRGKSIDKGTPRLSREPQYSAADRRRAVEREGASLKQATSTRPRLTAIQTRSNAFRYERVPCISEMARFTSWSKSPSCERPYVRPKSRDCKVSMAF